MKSILLKSLIGTILIAFLCQVSFVNAAQITKTLVEDTKITPPGVMAIYWREIPTFKKGTTVILNEYGEVIEGTLESYAELPCVSGEPFYYRHSYEAISINIVEPNRIRTFKAGTKVTFNSKGEVIKGTIGEIIASVPISQTSYIAVKKDTEVSFHGNGMIATCTLDYNTYLRPIGWQQNLTASYTNKLACPGFVEFKEKKII